MKFPYVKIFAKALFNFADRCKKSRQTETNEWPEPEPLYQMAYTLGRLTGDYSLARKVQIAFSDSANRILENNYSLQREGVIQMLDDMEKNLALELDKLGKGIDPVKRIEDLLIEWDADGDIPLCMDHASTSADLL